ncbi:hypothetical protein BC827DRAFT_1156728 [Russula dissimulans]|nr:hypothetical protein BC827DRAFT_1156728 [Russula dissimulans]
MSAHMVWVGHIVNNPTDLITCEFLQSILRSGEGQTQARYTSSHQPIHPPVGQFIGVAKRRSTHNSRIPRPARSMMLCLLNIASRGTPPLQLASTPVGRGRSGLVTKEFHLRWPVSSSLPLLRVITNIWRTSACPPTHRTAARSPPTWPSAERQRPTSTSASKLPSPLDRKPILAQLVHGTRTHRHPATSPINGRTC